MTLRLWQLLCLLKCQKDTDWIKIRCGHLSLLTATLHPLPISLCYLNDNFTIATLGMEWFRIKREEEDMLMLEGSLVTAYSTPGFKLLIFFKGRLTFRKQPLSSHFSKAFRLVGRKAALFNLPCHHLQWLWGVRKHGINRIDFLAGAYFRRYKPYRWWCLIHQEVHQLEIHCPRPIPKAPSNATAIQQLLFTLSTTPPLTLRSSSQLP